MIIEKLPPDKNYFKIKRQQSCRIKKANKYTISHLVKYCLRMFLNLESDVVPFNVLGNLLKRIEPEYLKVFFPRLNLGVGN